MTRILSHECQVVAEFQWQHLLSYARADSTVYPHRMKQYQVRPILSDLYLPKRNLQSFPGVASGARNAGDVHDFIRGYGVAPKFHPQRPLESRALQLQDVAQLSDSERIKTGIPHT